MLLMVQEMLKAVLAEELELQLTALNTAKEKIDFLDGDNAELRDQCARLEDDLANAQDRIAILDQNLSAAEEKLRDAEMEIESLNEELKSARDEMDQREKEKKKMVSSMVEMTEQVDLLQTNTTVVGMKVSQMEEVLSTRKEHLIKWKAIAQEMTMSGERKEAFPNHEVMAQHVAATAVSFLNAQVLTWQYKHIVQLDDQEGVNDSELQSVIQLTAELVSNITQIEHVYVAEMVKDAGKASSFSISLGDSEKSDPEPNDRFMYVATTPKNSFMVGQYLPGNTLTYRHFIASDNHAPVFVDIGKRTKELYFYKPLPDIPQQKGSYLAVPFFDLSGAVSGFIGIDTLNLIGQEGILNNSWVWTLLRGAAECVGQAMRLNKGLANDYGQNKGPCYFSKKIIERLAGKSDDDDQIHDNRDPVPSFVQKYPFLIEQGRRQYNVFGFSQSSVPRKQYFCSQLELSQYKMQDLTHLKHEMQEELFLSANRKKETRFLCMYTVCPQESLKVWRTIIVLLGLAGDEVLDPDPKVAWRKIKYLLSEERPAKERIYVLVKEYDPTDAKNLEPAAEHRYNLASGLLQTVRISWLQREGMFPVMLFQW
eukprot:CAMPEP_0184325222 /NCGR_PEP_ID=MMETSP1049-20130417/139345_1 /TAXON_ID=77928 /ORGANISM="Proteomonas sulcata, Strain CCMP704" /LENGTH=594 /DNA_ID=CAMNT_0026647221 /DNA_START=48 /DNA_END=1829 /DNA_ORIENTATION=+